MVMNVLLQIELSALIQTQSACISSSDRLPNVSHLGKREVKRQSLS